MTCKKQDPPTANQDLLQPSPDVVMLFLPFRWTRSCLLRQLLQTLPEQDESLMSTIVIIILLDTHVFNIYSCFYLTFWAPYKWADNTTYIMVWSTHHSNVPTHGHLITYPTPFCSLIEAFITPYKEYTCTEQEHHHKAWEQPQEWVYPSTKHYLTVEWKPNINEVLRLHENHQASPALFPGFTSWIACQGKYGVGRPKRFGHMHEIR